MSSFKFFVGKKGFQEGLDWKTEEYLSVQHQNEDSNQLSVLYYVPKRLLPLENKIFNPQSWTLDQFQVGRHLGRGKFGHVYLARERKSKHIIALKVLSKKQIVNSDLDNQIRRQIEIHTHLHNQNILQMYGFFFDINRIYLILQFATQGELYTVFRKEKKFAQNKTANYIKQTILAVQYLHSHQIIHRDIKPENMLLCSNDQVKLSDFGWSVHAKKRRRKTFCGTVDYLCPQIVSRKPYDNNVDIWTIGVLAYQLASGSAPFESKVKRETAKKIAKLDYQFPSHFSSELKQFIESILVINPDNRATLEELLQSKWIKIHTK